MKNTDKGFTLLELMVAIAIVGILATVAVPGFSDLLSDRRLAGAAEKIMADMEWARTISIRDNTNVVMDITADGSGAWCYGFDDADTSCNCSLTTTVASACTIDAINKRNDESNYGETTLNSSLADDDITFESRGVADDTGALTLTAGGKTVTINITRLGRGNICSDDLPQYHSC